MALRSDAEYIGAMGSKRAQKERRERLMEHGVTDEELARISAPVGLDLGATGARETALSIMAECVAVRYGRDGGRLCQKGADRKRIHAEAAALERPLAGAGSRGFRLGRRRPTSPRMLAQWLSSWRVESCSLRSTELTCVSTVRGLMPSRAPIRLYG